MSSVTVRITLKLTPEVMSVSVAVRLTPEVVSVSVAVRMMLKTACERLLSLFMLVAATVRDLLPSDIRLLMS